ncbi:MAG: recombinase RecR [Planctomycetes bacterium DG_23]|nr:MAG: recombinase RecR [Planctomycetes bacterium DG_23]
MAGYTKSLKNLIEAFGKLPGIGSRTAERLAYHILKSSRDEAMELAYAIRDVKKNIRNCSICFNIAETDPCEICSDPDRDSTKICVVEDHKDLLALEATGEYKGHYHVLMGHIAPLEDTGPEDLTIDKLIERVQKFGVKEIILATNPNAEGDMTALHIAERLKPSKVKITRLARGVAAGSSLEYANKAVLADAITGRTAL